MGMRVRGRVSIGIDLDLDLIGLPTVLWMCRIEIKWLIVTKLLFYLDTNTNSSFPVMMSFLYWLRREELNKLKKVPPLRTEPGTLGIWDILPDWANLTLIIRSLCSHTLSVSAKSSKSKSQLVHQ